MHFKVNSRRIHFLVLILFVLAACHFTPPTQKTSILPPTVKSSMTPVKVPIHKDLIQSASGKISTGSKGDQVSIKVYIRHSKPGFQTKNLDLNKIAKLKGWVLSHDITTQIWNAAGFVTVGGGSTNLQISGVPLGNNRVVTVQGYDAADTPIPGALLKAVYSSPVGGGTVPVTLTWYSTATAQILESLSTSNPTMASTLDVNALQSALDSIVYNGTTHVKPGTPGLTYNEFILHPKWLDPAAVATAIDGNGGTLPAGPAPPGWLLPKSNPNPDVVVHTAEDVNFKSAITVQITDPASSPGNIVANNDTVTMVDIVEGNWEIIATVPGLNGGVSGRANITINNDGSSVLAAGTAANPLLLGPVITQINGTAATTNDEGSVGAAVTFTGDGFNIADQINNNSVDFGGTAGTITGGDGLGTLLNVTVPANIFGEVQVSFTTGGLTGNQATFKVVPTITNFAPVSAVEGASITITGTGYDPTPGNNTVDFNGTAATVTGATNTTLTVTVPTGATTGKINVTTAGGTVQSTADFTVNNANAPTITNFAPGNSAIGVDGAGAPNTQITITGTNFTGSTAVKFNGVDAAAFTVDNATQITATIPLNATTGTLSVTNPDGLGVSATSFTVNSSVYTIAGTAGFSFPHGIAIDPSNGDFYIADSGSHKVVKLANNGDGTYTQSDYAGTTGAAGATDGARLGVAQFNGIEDMVVDTNGDLYIVDTVNDAIRRIVAATGLVDTIVDNATDGIDAPEGIDIGPDGKLYFTDNLPRCIPIFGCSPIFGVDGRVSQSNKDGSAYTVFAGGAGTGIFDHLEGLTINQTTGNIYVANTTDDIVKQVTVPGAVVSNYVTMPAGATFEMHEITIDAAGNVFVPGENNHEIYRVDAVTQAVTTIAGDGNSGFAEGSATTAQFRSPRDAAVDSDGNIYVADTDNDRIRKITP